MNEDVKRAYLGHDECCRAFDLALDRGDLSEAARLMKAATVWWDEACRLENIENLRRRNEG